jgi:hypothetical protein
MLRRVREKLRPLGRLTRAWAPVLVSLLVLGPMAGRVTGALLGPGAGQDATLLITLSPLLGLFAAGAVTLLATAALWLGSRVGGKAALLSAGLVLCWAAARTGRLDEIIAVQRRSPTPKLLLEGLLVALMAVGLSQALRGMARGMAAPSWSALRAAGFGVIAGVLVAWILAVEPLKGQTLAAAFGAGVIGAAVARMTAVAVAPYQLIAIPAGLALLGPLTTAAAGGDLVRDMLQGQLFRLSMVLPLDWLAGGMLGLPFGIMWTEAVVAQHSSAASNGPEPNRAGPNTTAPAGPEPTVM